MPSSSTRSSKSLSPPTNRPNMLELGNDSYLIRTQAGFRKVIKLYKDSCKTADNGDDYQLQNYPGYYPMVVVVTYKQYAQFMRYYIKCVSIEQHVKTINKKIDNLKKQLAILEA